MEDPEMSEFFRILGLVSTVEMLEKIEEGKNQYKYFLSLASVSTLSKRTKQLTDLRIIEHHIAKEGKRTEWYTLTERGKRVVRALRSLKKAFKGRKDVH